MKTQAVHLAQPGKQRTLCAVPFRSSILLTARGDHVTCKRCLVLLIQAKLRQDRPTVGLGGFRPRLP